tara:strand:- start:1242 stop:1361 length:120 start_codon:yes stop_codon:yes gene_type:complete
MRFGIGQNPRLQIGRDLWRIGPGCGKEIFQCGVTQCPIT